MTELIVIADDFTGALDTGAQFAKLGISTLVSCSREVSGILRGDKRVVCIDAETRHLSPDEAYETVYGIVSSARDMGVKRLFKKVDSTLRGQIGPELAAMLDAGGGQSVVFAPAYPALGRTTVEGIHLLDGKPLHESVFGRDPFEPAKRSDIAGIIREWRGTPATNIAVGQSPAIANGPRAEVYDAVTDGDLSFIARNAESRGERLFAGCAGFAQALAKLMAKTGAPLGAPIRKSGMLVVCGSLNPISDRQIACARGAGFGYAEIPLSLIERDEPDKAACAEFIDSLARNDTKGAKLLLTTPKNGVYERVVTTPERIRTAKRVGEVIKAWYDRAFDDTLVVTGGDTLRAFLDDMEPGVTLEPLCELQPGIICSLLRDESAGREAQIVSKAGGFGTDDVYIDIAARVLAREETLQEAR